MVYLDHASTSYPTKYFAKDYYIPGNSNSPHALGLQANQVLNEARQRIMNCLGVKSGKVLVGGIASQLVDNLMYNINKSYSTTIIGSVYEHDCFQRWLHYSFNRIPHFQFFKNEIICWMMTNNITGTIFPVEQIGNLCRDAGAYYIMDATATLGHYPIPDNLESFCDCLITSAHKYGGPQGTGCMWISDRFAKFLGLSDDSHEEYGLIHGTPNVSAAVAMSYAMKHAINNVEKNMQYWEKLVDQMMNSLAASSINALIHNNLKMNKTWAINAIYLHKINADALVQFLSSKGIYISPGHSACSSNDADATRVLEVFGLTKEQASYTVRISFSEDTTTEDIDAFVQGVKEFKEMFI